MVCFLLKMFPYLRLVSVCFGLVFKSENSVRRGLGRARTLGTDCLDSHLALSTDSDATQLPTLTGLHSGFPGSVSGKSSCLPAQEM